MKQIRNGVFETNSSSVHSLSIRATRDCMWEFTPLGGKFGEFGWGRETLFYPEEKLSYILTAIVYKATDKWWEETDKYSEKTIEKIKNNNYFKWLNNMVFETTGSVIEMIWDNGSWSPFGYIDHQSNNGMDVLGDLWSEDEETFKENMKQLVFNEKYQIIIDNDN